MIKICFICLGNICRSPMAEFIFKKLINDRGFSNAFFVSSKGTSNEEEGNFMHPKAIKALDKHHIPYHLHLAKQIHKEDYEKYDYFIAMDSLNIQSLNFLFGSDTKKKIYRLLDFTSSPKDIDDPWYTGDFTTCFFEIETGCTAFLTYLLEHIKRAK